MFFSSQMRLLMSPVEMNYSDRLNTLGTEQIAHQGAPSRARIIAMVLVLPPTNLIRHKLERLL